MAEGFESACQSGLAEAETLLVVGNVWQAGSYPQTGFGVVREVTRDVLEADFWPGNYRARRPATKKQSVLSTAPVSVSVD